MKRLIYIGSVIGAVILVAGGFLLFRDGGMLHCWVAKCYESKPASYWIEALRDKDPKVQEKGIDALYEIAPPSKEAARLLLAMVQADPNPNILPNTPADEACPETASYALMLVLEALGPNAKEFIPAITGLLQSQGVFHRIRACRLLGELGGNAREAIPALRKALSDEFPPIRKEASDALDKIEPEWLKGR
jgi:HEAT repeat protein